MDNKLYIIFESQKKDFCKQKIFMLMQVSGRQGAEGEKNRCILSRRNVKKVRFSCSYKIKT